MPIATPSRSLRRLPIRLVALSFSHSSIVFLRRLSWVRTPSSTFCSSKRPPTRRPSFSSSVQSSLLPLSRRSLSHRVSRHPSRLAPAPPLPSESQARSPPATLQWERRLRGWASVLTGCHVSVDRNKCVCPRVRVPARYRVLENGENRPRETARLVSSRVACRCSARKFFQRRASSPLHHDRSPLHAASHCPLATLRASSTRFRKHGSSLIQPRRSPVLLVRSSSSRGLWESSSSIGGICSRDRWWRRGGSTDWRRWVALPLLRQVNAGRSIFRGSRYG